MGEQLVLRDSEVQLFFTGRSVDACALCVGVDYQLPNADSMGTTTTAPPQQLFDTFSQYVVIVRLQKEIIRP